jgi:hypothetical protein
LDETCGPPHHGHRAVTELIQAARRLLSMTPIIQNFADSFQGINARSVYSPLAIAQRPRVARRRQEREAMSVILLR